jgi:hypothetical protein
MREMSDILNLKPLTSDWQEVSEDRIPDGLQWHVPPACQGQIVVTSYASDADACYMHQHDRSDRTHAWHARLWDEGEEFEPWNVEPR